MAKVRTAPVVIIGAGIVGSTVALELARYGVASTLVERSGRPPSHPSIDIIDAPGLDRLARLGVAVPAPAAASPAANGASAPAGTEVHWNRSLDEPPVAVWGSPGTQAVTGSYRRLPAGVLATATRDAARRHPLVDLRERWALSHLRVGPGGVTATIVDGRDGTRQVLDARFLVACDGTESTARRCLDIGWEEIDAPTARICVSFRSRDARLRRYGSAFLTITGTGVALVHGHPPDVWTARVRVGVDELFTADALAIVQERLGGDLVVDEVLGVEQEQTALAVARAYRSDAAFLAGDAAHQPGLADGPGVNLGLADAVDLAWKVAAEVQGWAGPALLDSYERDRRPAALRAQRHCASLVALAQGFTSLAATGADRDQLAGLLANHRDQWPREPVHYGQTYADRLGRFFTLVDLTTVDAGRALVKRAARRGVPMTHLVLDDPSSRDGLDGQLVLVRPDDRVAWQGEQPPDDWDDLLARLIGTQTP